MFRHTLPIRFVLLVAGALTFAPVARAQIVGQYSGLYPLAGGRKELGAYLGTGSGDMGFTVQGRVGSTRTLGYDVQASVQNSIFVGQLAAMANLMHTDGSYPLVLGGQLAAGVSSGGGATGLYIQGVPGLSYDWDAGGGQTFSFWGGLGLRLSSSTKHAGSSAGILRLGGRFDYSTDFGFAANLEDVDGHSTISVGIQYRFGAGGSNRP
jgi:hypothetical protein